jgi:hypothetical protein
MTNIEPGITGLEPAMTGFELWMTGWWAGYRSPCISFNGGLAGAFLMPASVSFQQKKRLFVFKKCALTPCILCAIVMQQADNSFF